MTWAQIRAWFTDNHDEMMLRVKGSTWAKHSIDVARTIIGWGEEGANNRGPQIDKLRRGRKLKPGQGGAWCATAMSYVIEDGWARSKGYTRWSWLPRQLQLRCPVKRTPNAKRLASRIAKAGCIVPEDQISSGDFALWKRRGGHHIGIVCRVTDDQFQTIEGNRGRFNRSTGKGSKVRRYSHEYGEPNLLYFARLP